MLQVLDELGGLVGTMEAFTRENREAIYKAANLRITYHPVEREVDLAVSLAPGGGANERVGGAFTTLSTPPVTRGELAPAV